MPLVQRTTYPYTESPSLDDVMSFLYGRAVTWGSEPRLPSCELAKVNYLLFRIVCHNIFSISHVHTIPIDRCIFLYALIISDSICFPSLFIQTIVEVYRIKSRKQRLFFLVFIRRILDYLELEHFPCLDLVHLTTPIGATFLKHRFAQKKTFEPSASTTKRPRVESITEDVPTDPPTKDVLINPTTAVPKDDDKDDANLDADVVGPSITPHSLCEMMETFMMTQAAHGQLLDDLISDVVVLRADFAKYRRSFPPLPLSDS